MIAVQNLGENTGHADNAGALPSHQNQAPAAYRRAPVRCGFCAGDCFPCGYGGVVQARKAQ